MARRRLPAPRRHRVQRTHIGIAAKELKERKKDPDFGPRETINQMLVCLPFLRSLRSFAALRLSPELWRNYSLEQAGNGRPAPNSLTFFEACLTLLAERGACHGGSASPNLLFAICYLLFAVRSTGRLETPVKLLWCHILFVSRYRPLVPEGVYHGPIAISPRLIRQWHPDFGASR